MDKAPLSASAPSTPKTDAYMREHGWESLDGTRQDYPHLSAFCRQLERELAIAVEHVARGEAAITELCEARSSTGLSNDPRELVRDARTRLLRAWEKSGEGALGPLSNLLTDIDHWLSGTPRSAIEPPSGKLTKPALVGNTRFGVGVSERMVIERAQRQYEYEVTPEKEKARIERVRTFVDSIKDGPHREESTVSQVGVCPRCGVNRFEAPCPNGHTAAITRECPMSGSAVDIGKVSDGA